jgi:hypothetical protein
MKTKWPSMNLNWCLWMRTTNRWACATMCLRRLRLGMGRMSVDLILLDSKSPPFAGFFIHDKDL